MNIAAEREEIIRKFNQINDISLLNAIKNLLDFGLSKQIEVNPELEASIQRGLTQSLKGETKPHEEVMAEIRKKYTA